MVSHFSRIRSLVALGCAIKKLVKREVEYLQTIWGKTSNTTAIRVYSSFFLLHSLGKTIQTLTRIVDGRAKKSDKEDGWAATTL